MRRSSFGQVLVWLLLLARMATTSDAAAIPSTYTVTDLGPVSDVLYQSAYSSYTPSSTVGNPVLDSTDGKTAYAFPRTTTTAPALLMSSISPAVPASNYDFGYEGAPTYSFNNPRGLLTADGLLVGQNFAGAGGSERQRSECGILDTAGQRRYLRPRSCALHSQQ